VPHPTSRALCTRAPLSASARIATPGCQLKHEIRRTPLAVTLYLLIELLGRHSVEHGQIPVELHLVTSHEEDATRDPRVGSDGKPCLRGTLVTPPTWGVNLWRERYTTIYRTPRLLWQWLRRLLGRPASACARLCRGAGRHEGGGRSRGGCSCSLRSAIAIQRWLVVATRLH